MIHRLNPLARLCLVFAYSLAWMAAAQQPLTQLAPADSALVVTLRAGDEFAPQLRRDLARLDWQGGGQVLESLLAAVDTDFVADDLAGSTDISGIRSVLDELCPALPQALNGSGGPTGFDAMLTVQPALFNVPVTVVVRFDELRAEGRSALRQALADCSSQTRSFEQANLNGSGSVYEFDLDGHPFYVAQSDSGLLVAGQDLRSTVAPLLERAAGSAAAQLEADPFSAFEAVDGYALGVALRTDPLLRSFGETMLTAAPGEGDSPARFRDAIDTVDSLAWRLTLGPDGVLNEFALTVDRDRPDAELARLLLCEGCRFARPYLAPADVVSFSSAPFPVGSFIDYLDGFIASSGEGNDLAELLGSELGVTVDPELLDSLGTGSYQYRLETISTDLADLLYRPGQVLVIPVSSAEAVSGSLESLLQSLGSLIAEQRPEFPVAVREAEYRGHDYLRVQASLNLDVGAGLVGDNLVVALPSRAIESAIDTYLGGPSLVGSARYRDLVSAAPGSVQGLSWHDTSATLSGIAELLELASQPLAFAARMAISETRSAEDFSVPEPEELLEEPLLLPEELQPLSPGTRPATLSDAGESRDQYVDGKLSDVYRLEGLAPGDTVSVVMDSQQLDTMLFLLDGEGHVLDSNDDAPDTTRSELVFTVEAGREYVVQATSYWGDATGDYRISVERAEGEAVDRLEPQPLAEGTVLGELEQTDAHAHGKLSDVYQLQGLAAGERVTITLESDEFDTMLYLRDASGEALRSNDDAPDTTRSEVEFVVEESASYQVQATSYWGDDVGSYALTVDTEAAGGAVEPPSFEELLSLFELPARLFEVLADDIGATTGYSVSGDVTLYSRGFTEFR